MFVLDVHCSSTWLGKSGERQKKVVGRSVRSMSTLGDRWVIQETGTAELDYL